MKKTIAKNKKAFFDYEILETLEAGVILIGSEVKSVKEGHIQLIGSFVSIREREAYLIGSHISPYKPGQEFDADRPKKLLMNYKEIDYLYGKSKTAGLTLIPTEIYIKNNLVKVAVSVARGKKKYDKREVQKKKDIEREIKRRYKI